MTQHARRASGYSRRGFLLLVVSLLWVALLSVPTSAQRAQAQTGVETATSFGDCSLRGGAPREILANELCWLDLSPLADPSNVGKTVTQRIGPNTLSYKVEYSSYNMTRTALADHVPMAAHGPAVFGNTFFTSTDAKKTILSQAGDGTARYGLQVGRFKLTDMKLTNALGENIPGVRYTVADAENTNSINEGEWIGINASSGISYKERLNSDQHREACRTTYGPGNEPKGASAGWDSSRSYQFLCHTAAGVLAADAYGSFFVTTGTDPKSLEINVGTVRNSTQAFAIALSVGRVTVPASNKVTTDTTLEQKVANTKTEFDYKVYRRAGTALEELTLAEGKTTPVVRSTSPAGDPNDQYVFTSAVVPDTGDRNLAIKRYKPVWKCSLYSVGGSESAHTISEDQVNVGNVPVGFALTWNDQKKRSELSVDASRNERVQCVVNWEPRFKSASLQLNKSVDGDASQFKDAALRTFDLNYACTDTIGFGDAYGAVNLSGTRNVQRGVPVTVPTLAAGLECRITESFPKTPTNPEGLPVAPGKRLDLRWEAGMHPSEDNTDQYQGADAAYSLTLKDGVNIASAYNRYTYLKGTLTIQKEILGAPVVDAEPGTDFYEPEYRFDVVCDSANKEFPGQVISMRRTGTVVNGQVVVNNIPVERDCTVRPLTDLDETQRQEFTLDGRVVRVDGGEPIAPVGGAYPFRLTEAKRTSVMEFKTSYSYKVRDVVVEKRLAGVASGSPELRNATFGFDYVCTTPAGGTRASEQTLTVTADAPAIVKNVPVFSECRFWETSMPETATVNHDGGTVQGTNRDGVQETVSNEAAKNQTVMVVQPTDASGRNVVLITNSYSNKIGTVDVAMTPATGPSGIALPDNYTVRFACGTRNVMLDGAIRPVELNGTVTVADGQAEKLVADVDDPALAALVNDQNGKLGVPYGNTCSFSSVSPEVPAGLLWHSEGGENGIAINAENQTVTINNNYENAGKGVTVYQTMLGRTELGEGTAKSYQLTCTLGGTTVFDQPITPQGASDPLVLSSLVPGTECALDEINPDDGTRGAQNYPIARSEKVTMTTNSVSFVAGNAEEGIGPDPVQTEFTVGETTTVAIELTYDYIYRPIHVSKNVQFDPATEQYISDTRKNDKKDRTYWANLVCNGPNGQEALDLRDRLTSRDNASTGEQQQYIDVNEMPVGSTCTLAEEDSDVASGIKLTRSISVDTGDVSQPNQPVSFTVGDKPVDAVVTNTFERLLTTVDVDKVAVLPGSVREQYENANQDLQEDLYLHHFTMVCKDPKTGDQEVLATFDDPNYAIKGESARSGTLTFRDVPVGADCTVTGDNFGSLHLEMNEAGTGDPLQAYLIPRQVDWVVDRVGGNTTPTGVDGGVSTSPAFLTTEATADGRTTNHIVLRNQYVYQTSKISMTKDVQGLPEDVAELRAFADQLPADNPLKFDFSMQCKAIGQQLSTLGNGDNGIPKTVTRDDLRNGETGTASDGQMYYRYTSPEAEVPAGSLCTFTELGEPAVPDTLNMSAVESQIRVNAPEPGMESAANAHFVNQLERRTSPVRFKLHNTGYFEGIDQAGYTAQFSCVYPGTDKPVPNSTREVTVAFDETQRQPLPLGNNVPFGGASLDLPAGVDCSVTVGGPAMRARKEIEVVDGDRRPYVQFATWNDNVAAENNPTQPLRDRSDISKEGQFLTSPLFTVPGVVSSQSGTSDFIVGAEVHHPHATADVKLTKRLRGASDIEQFTFASSCSDTRIFDLAPDGSITLNNVPVNTDCSITEKFDPDNDSWPTFEFASSGSRITEVADAASDNIAFHVHPVDSADDTRTSGDDWAVEMLNVTSKIDVTKRINGTPLSSVTGLWDTALLPGDATTMTVSYDVKNVGGATTRDFRVVDASLAGMTLRTPSGEQVAIGEDGVIPPSVCLPTDTALEPEEATTCTFDVDLPAPSPQPYDYRGEVTVTASTNSVTEVVGKSTYGAYRPSGLLKWALPESGEQTLVLFLLLGIALFGYGAWRVSRRDEPVEGGELVEM